MSRHWTLLGEAPIPQSDKRLLLYRGKDDCSIKISGGLELMNTRQHGSEDALGRLPCRKVASRKQVRVLIGGLGMGFTLAAALGELAEDARVVVAELIPEVVTWNRGELGAFAGHPLEDPRVEVHVGDVTDVLRGATNAFDVIALDVDNGPEGLTHAENDWLYNDAGLATVQGALTKRGIAAWWSAGPDRSFENRLRRAGFRVETNHVRAHGKRGPRHVIWLTTPVDAASRGTDAAGGGPRDIRRRGRKSRQR